MAIHISYRLCSALLGLACGAPIHAAEPPAPADPEVAVMPRTCHGQANDAIYVALGQDVFRVPGTPDRVGIYPMPYPKPGTAAPAAAGDAPPGCPDHPAEAFTLNLSLHQSSLLDQLPGLPPEPAAAINVARVGNSPYGELSAMNTLAMMVKRHPCRDVGSGLVECTGHADQKQGGSVLSSQASVYGTPLGHPFIVTCGFGPGIWAHDCQVHYQFSERLVLSYQLNRDLVPAARMIELDRAIRAGVQRLLMHPQH
ncbi:hypothetical protein KK141_09575 [Dyella sp. LX-66]|uniref:hypothetical protein n=1 Tax=unclassified Dyella TaxID=2634549 RepID=UPI001BE07F63|nr:MULTISPECIES: hypothetical protein [unclassified Dyella]MBT2117145.1 hypothetical protein [Dyella sp. LX-1]MBT2139779.1 hypothetical protein [Dyella sp. LX-66]